jgi:hypothetical protein
VRDAFAPLCLAWPGNPLPIAQRFPLLEFNVVILLNLVHMTTREVARDSKARGGVRSLFSSHRPCLTEET